MLIELIKTKNSHIRITLLVNVKAYSIIYDMPISKASKLNEKQTLLINLLYTIYYMPSVIWLIVYSFF